MTSVSRKGFTIIEVLIATAVLSIGLAAMMGMQIAFVNGSNSARDTMMATSIAESMVEQIKMEGASWTRNRSPTLDSNRHPRLRAVTDGPGAYHNMYDGRPMTSDGIPLHPGNTNYAEGQRVLERAKVGSRYCVDVKGRFLENSPTTIVGQVRVSWTTDGTAPWNDNNSGRCAPQGDNSEAFLIDDAGAIPGRRFVMVPFTIKQQVYAGEDGQ